MLRLLAGSLAGLLVGLLVASPWRSDSPSPGAALAQVSAPQQPVFRSPAANPPLPATLTPEERTNALVYRTVNPGVVNITTSVVQYDPLMGLPVAGGSGAGSGAVIDRQGHVLTNQHVIDGARAIEVTLASGATYPAKLVGADEQFDMAVIKIDAPAQVLFPINLGRSDDLVVGQKAYAVGNPFGLEGTLTVGIISSLNRSVPSRASNRVMTGMIQTDAAMNPGNSGGPLLNSRAEMVGMNVAIASKIGQNSGVGFAIPVARVKRYLPELIEHGKVLRAYHGIVTLDETPRGLRLRKLSRGGPAELAGLRGIRILETKRRRGPVLYLERRLDIENADTVIAIDGRPVSTHTDFLEIMDGLRPGASVVFTILRGGERQNLTVELGAA
ncbi:MAG: trypsin-like peptidase domain-containing protein [Planctomycetota bacterium]